MTLWYENDVNKKNMRDLVSGKYYLFMFRAYILKYTLYEYL